MRLVKALFIQQLIVFSLAFGLVSCDNGEPLPAETSGTKVKGHELQYFEGEDGHIYMYGYEWWGDKQSFGLTHAGKCFEVYPEKHPCN
jgi:hypothetical protein